MIRNKNLQTRSETLFTEVWDRMQGLGPWFLGNGIKTQNCIGLSQ